MNHKQVAERILNAVGRDNIQGAAHCATRLRLVLKDTGVIDQEALDNDPDLKGTFEAAGQYQIIVGPGDVNTVYEEFIKLTGISEASTADLKEFPHNYSALLIIFQSIPHRPTFKRAGLKIASKYEKLFFYKFVPLESITCLYQSNDFFLNLLFVPFPLSSKST